MGGLFMCIPINILVFENNNKASEALAKSNEMKVKLVTAQEMNNGYDPTKVITTFDFG